MRPVNTRKLWPPPPETSFAASEVLRVVTATTAAPSTHEQRGLECRKCGCRHFYVDNTRKAHRMIIRYRRCRYCGQRVTTCERVIVTEP